TDYKDFIVLVRQKRINVTFVKFLVIANRAGKSSAFPGKSFRSGGYFWVDISCRIFLFRL
ncbi:MAG TPA: hypothetical protein PLV27_08775, partial [Anaerolineaceae bacterium]|nr:hypothetical protein [Anaerolineaceae bacterium]